MSGHYVLGKYGEEWHVLTEHATLRECQHSIWWQGEPRGELEWHDKERTHATTGDSFRGKPTSTEWMICQPSNLKGVFMPLRAGFEPLHTTRGCYTQKAYDDMTARAVKEWMES